MTTYGGSTASSGSSSTSGTTQVAKEQAGQVGQSAAQAGGEVAQTTKEQAKEVVGEAKQQARDLAGELRTQVSDQAGGQRDRLVGQLRSLTGELDEMASKSDSNGLASELVRQLSSRADEFTTYLEQHQPADLLDDVRSLARRRPGAFLLGAALAGVVAGRLTRGVAAQRQSQSQSPSYGGSGTRVQSLGTTDVYPVDRGVSTSVGVTGSNYPAQGDPMDALPGTPAVGTRSFDEPYGTSRSGAVTP